MLPSKTIALLQNEKSVKIECESEFCFILEKWERNCLIQIGPSEKISKERFVIIFPKDLSWESPLAYAGMAQLFITEM